MSFSKANSRALAVAVLGFGLSAGTAQAITIDQTFTQSSMRTDFETDFQFQQFDTSLGTLTDVQFFFTGSLSAGIMLDNDGPSNASVFGDVESTIAIRDHDGAGNNLGSNIQFLVTASAEYATFFSPASLAPDDGDGIGSSNGGPDEQNIASLNASEMTTLTVNAADFGFFQGAGDLDFRLNTQTGFSISGTGSGSVTVTPDTFANGEVILQYRYSNPTPAVLPLMAIGLAGVAGFSRRRNRKAAA